MKKDLIELAYERMNHELGIHWSRINLTWLIVTAAFSALGYLLYQVAVLDPRESTSVDGMHQRIHLLLVITSAAALVASVVWRSIIVSGNIWVQVWEQKIGVMEAHVNSVLYLELGGNETSEQAILDDYRSRYGIRAKAHPSITVAYSHLSLIAILSSFAFLVTLVLAPEMFGVNSHPSWPHYTILGAAVFWSIMIEYPIAIDLRKNNRVLAKATVESLKSAVKNWDEGNTENEV